MNLNRVVVTGMGMVTPIGLNTESSWANSLTGKSGLSRITHFDCSRHAVQISGYCHEFNGAKLLDPLLPKEHAEAVGNMHRSTQMAMVAGYEAMAQSGLVITDQLSDDFGCYIGTGGGGTDLYLDIAEILATKGPSRVRSMYSFMLMPNHTAGMGALLFKARGPVDCVSSACCTGNDAMRLAFQEIQLGRCLAMLTGGTEACINPAVMASFATARAITRDFNDNPTAASRPFTLTRSGFVWGEGAVIFVMEELEHARNRRAKILFEIIGAYSTDDSYHETAPQPDGLGSQKAMRGAMLQAGISPEEVDLLSLHGTSTPLNDKTETLALKAVGLGEIPAYGSKSKVGHLIGASGPHSIAECYLGLRDEVVPGTLNYDDPDPECDLNLSRENRPLRLGAHIGLNNNAGFGGHNTCIIIRLWDQDAT